MTDQTTISVYDAQIDAYLKLVKSDNPHPWLLGFIDSVKAGGHVLDLGCGPGTAAHTMLEHGLSVDPVDASAEMVRLANETFKVNARQSLFSDIDSNDLYDGVWANFSLLHASRDDFPQHLAALAQALKPGGVFSIGMKTGTGSARDKLGRLYTYYSESELTGLLQSSGFTIDKVNSGESRGLAGSVDPWTTIIAINSSV